MSEWCGSQPGVFSTLKTKELAYSRNCFVTLFRTLAYEALIQGLSCSVAQSCLTLCTPMNCSTAGFPVLHHLPELAQTHVHWVGDTIQPSYPLSTPFSPAFNLSQHQIPVSQFFTSGGQYWSFSINISPSNDHSGLVSFRIDWFDLLAVQGTLKSLLQHHSPKASVLWCSAFFIVQLSHPYVTTGRTIALTRWTTVGKVMSLLFNMLSRY